MPTCIDIATSLVTLAVDFLDSHKITSMFEFMPLLVTAKPDKNLAVGRVKYGARQGQRGPVYLKT
jgi:hypothetical protein